MGSRATGRGARRRGRVDVDDDGRGRGRAGRGGARRALADRPTREAAEDEDARATEREPGEVEGGGGRRRRDE